MCTKLNVKRIGENSSCKLCIAILHGSQKIHIWSKNFTNTFEYWKKENSVILNKTEIIKAIEAKGLER